MPTFSVLVLADTYGHLSMSVYSLCYTLQQHCAMALQSGLLGGDSFFTLTRVHPYVYIHKDIYIII